MLDLQELLQQSDITVAEMHEDGIEADDVFEIEHHLVASDFNMAEKVAVQLVKAGYDVGDAEEFNEDGKTLFYFAAVKESAIDPALLQEQTKEVFQAATDFQVEYDGWGVAIDEDNWDEEDSEEDGSEKDGSEEE